MAVWMAASMAATMAALTDAWMVGVKVDVKAVQTVASLAAVMVVTTDSSDQWRTLLVCLLADWMAGLMAGWMVDH
jgi:predicted Zn-dependent protease